jgi:hypothetical protein
MNRRSKRWLDFADAPVAQTDQSSSLLRSRLEVRVLPGALSDAADRTDGSTVELPAFNRKVAGSNPARCIEFGSVAQSGTRRLAQNEDVAGSNPVRTTEGYSEPNWLLMALAYLQMFRGW